MNQLATQDESQIIESLVLNGDIGKLSSQQRIQYYNHICQRLGLDPLTQPFKILNLSGRQVLYCDRSGAQQLNKIHNVSHEVKSRELMADVSVYQVTARASLPDGRFTDSIGAVNIGGMKGNDYANAIMKAETKAKRRSTLDLLGLGMLDETEIETIKGAISEDVPKLELPKAKNEEIGICGGGKQFKETPTIPLELVKTPLESTISINNEEIYLLAESNGWTRHDVDKYKKTLGYDKDTVVLEQDVKTISDFFKQIKKDYLAKINDK